MESVTRPPASPGNSVSAPVAGVPFRGAWTLRARLTLALLLFSLVPLVVLATLTGQLVLRDAARRESGQLEARAASVAEHVSRRVELVRTVSLDVAEQLAATEPQAETWNAVIRTSGYRYPLGTRLVGILPDGQPIASSDGRLAGRVALPVVFAGVLQTRQPAWDLGPDPVSARSMLILYTPIARDASTALLGVLGTSLDLEELSFESGISGDASQLALMAVAGDGRVVLSADPAAVQSRPVVDPQLLAAARARPAAPLPLSSVPGVRGADVPATDWMVLAEPAEGDGFGSAAPWLGLALGVLLTGAVAAIAAVFLARDLTRPLAALTNAVRAFVSGDPAAPLPVNQGEPAEIAELVDAFAIMRAELSQALERLHQSEERYRRLAENAPDLVYRYDLEPPRFTYVSPASARITGYTPDEYYADPLLADRIVHPDDHPSYQALTDALQSGQAVPEDPTLRCVRKDGGTIWVEQRLTPMYDSAGSLTAVEGIVRDVSERVLLSATIERERAVLSAILTSMHDGVLLLDASHQVMYANPAAGPLLGVETESLTRSNYEDVIQLLRPRLRDADAYEEKWWETLVHTTEPTTFEMGMVGSAAGDLQVQLLPVPGGAERDAGIALILTDVTDVKRLARIEERERIAMDLHDGVIQQLYALSLELGAHARATEPSATSTRAVLRRAVATVGDVIDETRTQVDLLQQIRGDLRTRLEHLLRAVAAGTSLATELSIDPVAESLLGPSMSAEALFVVWEAASNAGRHAEATHLTVLCEREGPFLRFIVRDDGRGFAVDEQRSGPGRGLRNMAARAQAMGATLEIDSEPAKGTEVRLRIPVDQGRPA
jgi:PAS domain S-box-containing protein